MSHPRYAIVETEREERLTRALEDRARVFSVSEPHAEVANPLVCAGCRSQCHQLQMLYPSASSASYRLCGRLSSTLQTNGMAKVSCYHAVPSDRLYRRTRLGPGGQASTSPHIVNRPDTGRIQVFTPDCSHRVSIEFVALAL